MISLTEIPQKSITADIHGLISVLVFIEIGILILLPSWLNRVSAFIAILLLCACAAIGGDGTLTLIHDEIDNADSNIRAVFLCGDRTVLVNGPEVVVHAITNGGFRLSHTFLDLRHHLAWHVARGAVFEGLYLGLCYSVIAMPMIRFLGVMPLVPLATFMGLPLIAPSLNRISREALQLLRGPGDATERPTRVTGTIYTEFLKVMASGIPFGGFLLLCEYTSARNSMPRMADLVRSTILGLLPVVPPTIIFLLPSENYPLNPVKFFGILGHLRVARWRCRTTAVAATLQCLSLCHGLTRPIKEIDIRGVLDTLILDQRGVWGAWKARVADRITHEEDICFLPTLPTFRDERQQTQLKQYLQQAQSAYTAYREHFSATAV